MNKRSGAKVLVPQILELYKNGMSTPEIGELLNLPVSLRQVQRIIKKFGITRTKSEAFRLAIKKE